VIVLGLDTATRSCGYGVLNVNLDASGHRYRYRECGVLTSDFADPVSRYCEIVTEVENLVREHRPARAVLELHSFGVGRNAIGLHELGGALAVSLRRICGDVIRLRPGTWRKATFGRGRATKAEAIAWVRAQLGVELRDNQDDEAEALCLAVAGARWTP